MRPKFSLVGAKMSAPTPRPPMNVVRPNVETTWLTPNSSEMPSDAEEYAEEAKEMPNSMKQAHETMSHFFHFGQFRG